MKTLELRTFGALFLLAVFVFLVDGTGLLDTPKSAVQVITVPIQYAVYSAKRGVGETFSFLTFWKSGEARIKNLEQRNLELSATISESAALKQENNELRKQLGAKILADRKLLPAIVLGSGRYLEIGLGTNDAVKEGQTVVYLNNLVGKIVRTTPKASFVQLPTDPQAKIPVKINKARGLVIGQFNSSMQLDRVAQTEEIAENDPILTSGEGDSFPPDLVVGKLGKIISAGTDLFKKATVLPILDYSGLETVFVLSD